MTTFVDASALVAIAAKEPERDALIERLAFEEGAILWSPMAFWESVSSLRSSHKLPFEEARKTVERNADTIGLALVPIGAAELEAALDAYQRYGKRSGHKAKLNMGDCFAYACAKTQNAKLLYKGDDFAHTDLA